MFKKIIVANWKMNPKNIKEAEKLFSGILKSSKNLKNTQIIICPPFLYLEKLIKVSKNKNISFGGQNAYMGAVGPFTGEISFSMLSSLKTKYVIIGHSERREMGEDNILINKKIKEALSLKLTPILCIGEKTRDENHEYLNMIKNQILECLSGISKEMISKVMIAYEPIWALSTTKNRADANSNISLEMSIFIKKIISDKFGIQKNFPKILYGGSVNENDIEDFLKNGGIDGVLVGRASLDIKKFSKIINICEVSKN